MVLIANIISLLGMLIMLASGFVKEKQKFIGVQCIQICFLTAANACLSATTGVITNIISIMRNLLIMFGKANKLTNILIVGATAGISIACNKDGWFGLIPLLSVIPYTLTMEHLNDKQLKIATMLSILPWAVYDFGKMNYVAFCFDIAAVITNFFGYRNLKNAYEGKLLEGPVIIEK